MLLNELGNGNKRGVLAIPKGRNGQGWEDFVYNLHLLIGSLASVSTDKNRVKSSLISRRGIGGPYVMVGPSSPNGVSYATALRNKAPTPTGGLSARTVDDDWKQKKKLGEETSKVREAVSHATTNCQRLESKVGRSAPFNACTAVGEAEGALWAVKAELSGMQERILKLVR